MQEVLNEIYQAYYYKQVMFTTLMLGFFVNHVLHSFFVLEYFIFQRSTS
jgi:hypothetical protein